MASFYTGDELGNIKSLKHIKSTETGETKLTATTLFDGTTSGKEKGVQKLVVGPTSSENKLLTAARADGSIAVFTRIEGESESLKILHEWKETRIKTGQTFVGLAAAENRIFSCTSNGALRLSAIDESSEAESPLKHITASLPMRLCDWRLSSDAQNFAYGGDEVELSLWDTEKAFTSSPLKPASDDPSSKKRKRGQDLLPGEIWRAKNVPNDFLTLRQPVYNTTLTFLSPSSAPSKQHLLAGTVFGNLRRYDTRAGRRPVADWEKVAKTGGIKVVEKGFAEHEAFVSDQGCNLFAMDLRNGKVLYGYKGISGAITSISPNPTHLASIGLDRFFRLHSTHPPPSSPEQRQETRGEVLEKVYMKSIPTVVVWDQVDDEGMGEEEKDDQREEDDEMWDGMENVESDEDSGETRKKGRKKHD